MKLLAVAGAEDEWERTVSGLGVWRQMPGDALGNIGDARQPAETMAFSLTTLAGGAIRCFAEAALGRQPLGKVPQAGELGSVALAQ